MTAALERPAKQPLTIRRATLEDMDELLELEQLFPGDRLEKSNFRYFLTKAKADIWIVEERVEILGDAVVLYRQGFHSARLYSIVVSPKARGKGIGAKLLAHCENAAKERGCITLRLEVREDNDAAINLYRSKGYTLIGRTDDFYEDGSTALRMRKRLDKMPAVLLEVPFYSQTLDFTCGPACLMMAMRYLGSSKKMTRVLETELWREATTIFMMSGHGGCSAEGLAVAALRRGFSATVYTRDTTIPFIDSVRAKSKKEIIALSYQEFMRELEKLGGEVRVGNFTDVDVLDAIRQGSIPLVLLSSYRLYDKKELHWAVVSGFDDEHLYLHDPWIPKGLERADALHLPLKRKDFEKFSRFGKARHRYMVVLSKRNEEEAKQTR
jgi:ribosomal protein S18 acetylase RimI-like enzyme/predicted double-glycine peptidase